MTSSCVSDRRLSRRLHSRYRQRQSKRHRSSADSAVDDGLPADAAGGRQGSIVDALIARAKKLHGDDGFDQIRQQSLESIRDDIEDDLAEFGVTFDTWYSEQSLTKNGRIDDALGVSRARHALQERRRDLVSGDRFGDEKDRVVIRENGVKTYFASDIAYHFEKRERGFDHLIDILGADHHGYVTRVRAGLEAMGYDGDSLEVNLVQFVTLYRGGKKMQMSTRSGEFDTLRQLRAEVGNDAARFYYVIALERPAPRLRPRRRQVTVQRQSRVLHPVRARARRQRFPAAGGKITQWNEGDG